MPRNGSSDVAAAAVDVGALIVEIGCPHPLGVTVDAEGVNFSIFSEKATAVTLLLFEREGAPTAAREVTLCPVRHRTFHFWHVYLRGARPGLQYAYRVDGPRDVHEGYRFNPKKVLIDPYGRAVSKTVWNRGAACNDADNIATALRSVVIDTSGYDWEGDKPLHRPMSETVVYEVHVGGLTRSPTSGVAHPGTFQGLVEKIPYLKALGITAVELMPVFDFDETDYRMVDGRKLVNYWGYSTMAYFAPHAGYCSDPLLANRVREFRDMVKALHKEGIEVILDVVFNHTDEGNHQGPTFSFRGIDNTTYYYLSPQDKQYYYDYTGCGNTFNCNHPIGEKFIVDCLKYWVNEMHVDGFRFDEGSVLSRGEDGAPMRHPPVLWEIELNDALAGTKVIAEAWDAGGLYQIGIFPGYRWGEWNGRYRDDIRRFVKGDAGLVDKLASRISGSSDLYQDSGRAPINSVNFVNAHDGFTLNDLVSYNGKHNDANGEGNRDGIDDNLSWNCGAEGETADAGIEALRSRQIRNFAAILMLSQGVPMMVMGDEVRRTQGGNNNGWCQDNATSWFDWTLVDRHADMLRFWQQMIAFRRRHSVVHRCRFFTGAVNDRGLRDIAWYGCRLVEPHWDDPYARVLSFTLGGFDGEDDIHVILNMYWDRLVFDLPQVPGRRWHRVVDTSRPSPDDIVDPGHEVPLQTMDYTADARSVVILLSK